MPLFPTPPMNVMVVSPFNKGGTLDIRWDDPSLLHCNTVYDIVGINVYRDV